MDVIAASGVSIVAPLSSATLVASSSGVARAVVYTAATTTQSDHGRVALGVVSGDRFNLVARALYVAHFLCQRFFKEGTCLDCFVSLRTLCFCMETYIG